MNPFKPFSPLSTFHLPSLRPAYCFRILACFGLAVLVTYTLASALQTVSVLQSLKSAGAEMALRTHWQAVWHDLYGLAFGGKYVSLLQTITIGFALALPVATLVNKYLPLPRCLIFALAGATAMATILLAVKHQFYNLILFAGTRGGIGFGLQLLAGAFGGWVFAILGHFRCVSVQGDDHE